MADLGLARRITGKTMSDIIEILRLAKKPIESFFTQRRLVAEKSWEEVILALNTLSELSNHHVKAIAEVTAPILNRGDLIETSRRYDLLVNNPDFPQGYDMIRGVLAATRSLPTFREASVKEKVQAVIDASVKFQYGAFTLGWDSYHVADAFREAARVAADEQPSADDVVRVTAPFIQTFTGLFQNASDARPPKPPTTTAEMIAFLQWFCRSWQRYVQNTLYGGQGLNSAIGQLKMQQFA